MDEKKLYAFGYVENPIQYAINTLKVMETVIGQDKRVTFAIMALEEYQKEQISEEQNG